MSDTPAVVVRGLTKSFSRGAEIVTPLRQFDLTLDRGVVAVLTGPSGSGKSTLLNLLAGYDDPDQGDILLGGQLLSAMSPERLDRLRSGFVGFIFQQFNLVPGLSACENVELALLPARVPRPERRRRAVEAMSRLGLAGLEWRRPHQLSGGQQQRVAVARALVGDPVLILADEPTAALDRENASVMLRDLRTLANERGVTVLMSSHDPNCLAAADVVIALEQREHA